MGYRAASLFGAHARQILFRFVVVARLVSSRPHPRWMFCWDRRSRQSDYHKGQEAISLILHPREARPFLFHLAAFLVVLFVDWLAP